MMQDNRNIAWATNKATPAALDNPVSSRFSKLLSSFAAAVLMLVGVIASPAFSATYYVDFSSGNNSNSGTSSSAAFKHCPGDSNASGNAARTLVAGDVVIFKGGVVYSGQIDVNGSGTSSARITFLSGHLASPAWGSARGIVDGGLSRQFGFFVNSRSYITIEGLEIRNIGAPTSDAAAIDFENWSGSCDNNIVRNCVIHDVNWQGSYVRAYGIENNGGANHIYEYNEVYNATDKLIEMYGGGGRGNNSANHNIVRFNTIHNSSVHGIVLTSDDDSVYSNIIYQINDGTRSNSPNPGFGLKVDQGSRNMIYNNILYATNAGLGVLAGDDNKFYHNVIYGLGTNGSGYHGSGDEAALVVYDDDSHGSWSTPVVMRNQFANNIVYFMNGGSGQISYMFVYFKNDGGSGNAFKDNLFCKTSGDTALTGDRIRRRDSSGYAYSNVTDWQANFNSWEGGSSNVATGNIVADAGFSGGSLGSLSNKPTGFSGNTPNASGFEIGAASPALAGGIVLGSPVDKDIRLSSRSKYTLGAYESGGTPVTLSSPTNLRIVP